MASCLLPAERAALSKTGLATGGLAEDLGAAGADDDSLGVREDSGDGEAAGALDVHEEGAGAGHKGLMGIVRDATQGGDSGFLVGSYLQLVLAGLVLRAGVEKVDGENLSRGVSGWCSRWYPVVLIFTGGGAAQSLLSCACAGPPCSHRPVCPQLVCDVPYWRLPDFNWRYRLRRGSFSMVSSMDWYRA